MFRRTPIPGTRRGRRHNPEKRKFRGRSHRRGGRVRDLRASLILGGG